MTPQRKSINTKTVVNHRTIVGKIRRAKTRIKILEAALHVFAEKGPQGTVIDDFIKAADIARGTFYNYFRSTEELLDATIAWLNEDLHTSIGEAIVGIEPPVVRLGVGVRLWMKTARENRAWCGFVAQVRLEGSEAVQRPLSDLKAAIQANEVNVPSIKAALDLMEGTGTKAMQHIMNHPEDVEYCDDIAAMILQGLGVSPNILAQIVAHPIPELGHPIKSIE